MIDPGDSPARRSLATVELLSRSPFYRGYERAFQEATGLPLAIRPLEAPELPHRGSPYENPFCALMATSSHGCAACREAQRKVERSVGFKPRTYKCFAGLCCSVVPIRVGEDLVAVLHTGQILLQRPERQDFARLSRQVLKWGAGIDLKRAEEAYFRTRVLTKAQYESILRLLGIFAQHLGALSNQLAVQDSRTESPQIARARAYIDEHQDEDLSLSDVARTVNMSAFYFCKMFKQATGLNFTDYLARIRVEKVKSLLLDPNRRVSEAAFSAGFQSLSQFNRVFRKVAGESPSAYRARVHRTVAA